MVNHPLFFWHAPPCEIELIPRSAIDDLLTHLIVSLTTQEFLFDVLPVEEVAYQARSHASVNGAISEVIHILFRHALD